MSVLRFARVEGWILDIIRYLGAIQYTTMQQQDFQHVQRI
jgi:hypothetical protein